jgi:hypothetical protein
MAVTWKQFADLRPDLAAAGSTMLRPWGVGLGFLGTVRPDGGPRVNPICPVVTDEALYAFLVVGPKLHDLRRDPRYALHSETVPPPNHDDAFSLKGDVRFVDDTIGDGPALRRTLVQQMLHERSMTEMWEGFEDNVLLELLIDRCLLTLTVERPDLPKGHTVWVAPSDDRPT